MKDYKVRAIKSFTDGLENVSRVSGDIFDCTEERYNVLKENNAVELIAIQRTVDEVIEEVVEEKKKKLSLKKQLKRKASNFFLFRGMS